MKKERIDKLLLVKGFAESLSKAQALVMAGVVLANEQRVEKSSQIFDEEISIRLKNDAPENKFVGRGGLKLERALREFQIDASGLICLDVGASTGGFTDCLLQNGALKVVAVDAGTNQLVWKLRVDERVESRENTNARFLTPADFVETFELIVVDVSFISVTKIFPAITNLLNENGKIVVLIKPQFEVARHEVGAGGIVTEPDKHERVILEVNQSAAKHGLQTRGVIASPITGADGNVEFLAFYERI